MLEGIADELCIVLHVHFLEHACPVRAHGFHTQCELFRQFLHTLSERDSFHYLVFTVREPFVSARFCFPADIVYQPFRDSLTYFFPDATFRIASINNSGAQLFVRYPDAPARSARIAYCSSGNMLKIRTGV
jgi:hypothetical protein